MSDEMFPDPEPVETIEEEDLSWGDKRLKNPDRYRYETVAYMAASGMSPQGIAEQTGMTAQWISVVMGNAHVKKRIKEIQEKQWGGNIEKRFKAGLPKAMDVVEQVIRESSDDRLKLDASKWLLEKVTGKPSQQVNVEGNLIGDLLGQLDEIREARSAGEETILLAEVERDPMDEWILNNVPTHSGVGRKDQGEDDGKE